MRRLLPIALLAASCHVTTERAPVGLEHAAPRLCAPTRAWELVDASRVVGVVVEFVEQERRERRFFSVRDAHQQERGLVDGQGRAWRYRPHADEADWLGTGRVIDGAARILAVDQQCEMFAIELGALAAEAARKLPEGQ